MWVGIGDKGGGELERESTKFRLDLFESYAF